MAYLIIVDDDQDFATAAAMTLRGAGHEVDIIADAFEAVEIMEKRPPDLAILDVMFPEDASAGFELARAMRHHAEKLQAVPILMLTAVNRRFALGFSSSDVDNDWLPVGDFLEKPVDPNVLVSRVEALVDRRPIADDADKPEESVGDRCRSRSPAAVTPRPAE